MTETQQPETRSWWRGRGPLGVQPLVWLFLLALVLRIVAGAIWNVIPGWQGEPVLRGFYFYVEMAENVLAGEGPHWTMYMDLGERHAGRPPLFAFMVAGILALTGSAVWPVLIAQALLGAARTVFVALCGREIGGARIGVIAGLLAACYPYWVGNDATMLENTLFGALVAGGVWLVLRVRLGRGGTRTIVVAGLLFGLAALTREMIGLFLPVIALMLLFRPRDVTFRRRFVLVTLLTVTVIAVTAPWIVRNARLTGRASLSTSTGRALWLGNNEHTFAVYPRMSIDQSELVAWKHLSREQKQRLWDVADDEVAQDIVFGEMATTWIRANRGEFVERGFRKVGALFSPMISGAYQRSLLRKLGYTGGYGGLLILGLAGFIVGWRRLGPWRTLTIGAYGSLALMAYVYWGQARLRAIYDFFLIVPAALTVDAVLLRLRGPRGSGVEDTPVP